MIDKKEAKLVKLIGRRLLAEANDLKRTLATVENDLHLQENDLEMISCGKMSMQRTLTIVNLFAEKYPVKISDILLDHKSSHCQLLQSRVTLHYLLL